MTTICQWPDCYKKTSGYTYCLTHKAEAQASGITDVGLAASTDDPLANEKTREQFKQLAYDMGKPVPTDGYAAEQLQATHDRYMALSLAPLCVGNCCASTHGYYIERFPEYATCNCPNCRQIKGVSETEWFNCEECDVRYRGSNPRLCAYCSIRELPRCSRCDASNVALAHTLCPDCLRKVRAEHDT